MIAYINTLRDTMSVLDNNAADLHIRAGRFPIGSERDECIRRWRLTWGKAQGVQLALDLLQQYLHDCQVALED